MRNSATTITMDRRRVLEIMGVSALAAGLFGSFLTREAFGATRMPGDVLMNEHGVILTVQNAAEGEVRRIRQGGEIDKDRLLKMIEFFQEFGDRCHHGKEEDMYFPAAVKRNGKKVEEIVNRMEKEHVIFRGLLESVKSALRSGDMAEKDLRLAITERLGVYSEMLYEHIEIENIELFTEIEFTAEKREELLERFRRFENEVLGEGFHEKYKKMARDIVAG